MKTLFITSSLLIAMIISSETAQASGLTMPFNCKSGLSVGSPVWFLNGNYDEVVFYYNGGPAVPPGYTGTVYPTQAAAEAACEAAATAAAAAAKAAAAAAAVAGAAITSVGGTIPTAPR